MFSRATSPPSTFSFHRLPGDPGRGRTDRFMAHGPVPVRVLPGRSARRVVFGEHAPKAGGGLSISVARFSNSRLCACRETVEAAASAS